MRIGIYTNADTLQVEDSSTRYVYESLRDSFDVRLYSDRDETVCKDDDVVFCRFRRPVDLDFLARLGPYRDKVIINDPAAQISHQSKRNLLFFPDLTPPTAVFDSAEELLQWAEPFERVVLKPLNGHKGKGIVRLQLKETHRTRLLREVRASLAKSGGTVMAQEYVDGVEELGDKRINVFGFRPISAIVRYPAPGSFICNLACGGTAAAAEISANDQRILDRVIPFLREHGIWWAAIDVIGDYLTEINIATPCTIWVADMIHGDRRGSDAFRSGMAELQRQRGF